VTMRHFLSPLCTLLCQYSAIVKDSPKTALESVRSFQYLSLGDVGITAVDRADLISRYLTGDNDICQAYSRRAAAGVILFRTSGVAMGWAGEGAKSRGPPSAGARSSRQKLEMYGRFVHVGETCNKFIDFGL